MAAVRGDVSANGLHTAYGDLQAAVVLSYKRMLNNSPKLLAEKLEELAATM